jgi:hypothetical protein
MYSPIAITTTAAYSDHAEAERRDHIAGDGGERAEPRLHGAGDSGLPCRVGRSDGADLGELGDRVDAARQVQLRRRVDDGLDLVGDGADLNHQCGRQDDDADGLVRVLLGDRQQPRPDELRRLFALDECDAELAQHRGDLRVVVVLTLGQRLGYLLADRLQQPSRPVVHRPALMASTTSSVVTTAA